MSVIKAVNATELDEKLSLVANAIRAKSGGNSPLSFPDGMAAAIEAIPSADGLVDTSDATATAADIALGKTAYVNGVKIVGTYAQSTPSQKFTVSGVWHFEPMVDALENTQYVSFTSNGSSYTAMSNTSTSPISTLAFNPTPSNDFILYYDTTEVYDSYDSWFRDSFRTVDFGSTPQEVSEEFYSWLSANATKQ